MSDRALGNTTSVFWLALGEQRYRFFLIDQLTSQVGRRMQLTAQAWLVLDLTGSGVALGTVTALQYAPFLLLSLFTGLLSGRFPPRGVLAALQATAGCQVAVLAILVLTGQVGLWHLYVMAALSGTIDAIDNLARQAFLGNVVAPSEIQSAVGLNAWVQNFARIVGPAFAGLVIAGLGTGWCLALSTLGFAAALAALAAMGAVMRPLAGAAVGRLYEQIADGVRYVARDRELLIPLVLLGLVGGFGCNWNVSLPLLARYAFQVDAIGFGVFNAAVGLGYLVGALVVASRQQSTALQLAWIATMVSLLLMSLAVAPTYWIAVVLLVAAGCGGGLLTAGVTTTIQLRSRPEFKVRVLSLFFFVWAVGVPIGGAVTGFLAASTDIRAALAFTALACLVGSAAAVAYIVRTVGAWTGGAASG